MPLPPGYTSHVAIALPPDEQVRTVLGESYQPGATLNVVKMFAGTADLAPPIAGLVDAIFKAEGIDPKAREMIILRVAKNLNCPYEWQANTTLARNVGLSQQEIDAVSADGPVDGVAPEYVLLCAAADELATEHTLSDETLASMLDRYDETTCRKLVLMMSWFHMLSLFLNACRVPLETTDKVGSRTSPL